MFYIRNLKSGESVNYRIVDNTGRVLQQGTVGSGRKVEVNGSIVPGSYILLLDTNRGTQSIKFIKQP
jgi:hypothetical protein